MIVVSSLKYLSILGFGISAISAIEYYLANKPQTKIRVSDLKSRDKFASLEAKIQEFSRLGLEFEFGSQSIDFISFGLEAFSKELFVMVSPGIPPSAPIIQKLEYPMGTDFDLFLNDCSSKKIAVTGTNGKTTTTSLIAYILDSEPLGNIGTPFLEWNKLQNNSALALELSSFQLFYSNALNEKAFPEVSVYLNMTDDHLDWHKDLNEYQESKAKLFQVFKNKANTLVMNYDDNIVKNLAENKLAEIQKQKAQTRLRYFSTEIILEPTELIPAVGYLKNDTLYLAKLNQGADYGDGIVMQNKDGEYFTEISFAKINELNLVGKHNYSNILAAALGCDGLDIPIETIKERIQEFKPVRHRLEYVGSIDGHKCYNDSKATNPDSANKALDAFTQSIAIVGGKDKHLDLSSFIIKLTEKTSAVVAIGELKDSIIDKLKAAGFTNTVAATSLEDALHKALGLASKIPEIPIVLAPASSSFDMFKNYEDRGDQFRTLVKAALKN